ncbi:serine/threonine-protein kinase HipA [Microbacteriaceae bacterium SG_E_30_P1]|uniref:Serine/threonine-protein kinase HipA n=1 Tax=Antiquaquibacter oligotrophicus TaxID=2880260 RepID=A0ABT6KSY5_9MICO|nr:HipA domain-containing protein [Antiquaquibacter oligotrophicus]MDH6182172.1 serine/threonine-protein kinase HipA [Antiquaquibacter oligotrophicus]UDF12166.1 HipA domain-containing protein [Antiquaquibacter oligotrophicus]
MIRALDVYLYDAHVARVTRRGDNLQLRYLPEYIESDDPVPISVTLPVVNTPFGNDDTKRFLDNLLPDRADVRSRWAQGAQLTSDSTFDLLSVYGADVAGALEFYAAGTSPRQEENLTPLTDKEIGDRIRQIRQDDSDWLQNRAVEEGFSLGGAQGKFALTLRDEQWFEPSGRQPSTHIFKPGIQALHGSDVTEHITLQVARLLGIDAAASAIAEFDGEHVLVVERFDRFDDRGTIRRLHQEDLAQATGTPRVQKYEADGGPGYRDIFTVFDRNLSASDAKTAKERFAKLHVFSWIIGHNDGHSKNYSLSHVRGRSVLAPFYDLNSSLPFKQREQVLAHDPSVFDNVELAFAVGGANTLGTFNGDSIRHLEADAGVAEGHLRDFALQIASLLQFVVADAIEPLPERLKELSAVTLYPHATYTQTLRVLSALA